TQAQHLTEPTVFMSDGKPWTLKPKQYDISVFFPPGTSSMQRAHWAGLGGLRFAYTASADLCRGQFPCLVEARYANEPEDAVAADRTLLTVPESNSLERQATFHEVPPSRLFLRPGKYRVTATDRNNHTLSATDVVIAGRSEQERNGQRLPPYGAV